MMSFEKVFSWVLALHLIVLTALFVAFVIDYSTALGYVLAAWCGFAGGVTCARLIRHAQG